MCAIGFAAALNCETEEADACGECGSCGKVGRGIHPDVRVLETPEGKRRIPIELVREAERWLAVSPHEGKAKVLVIDPADQMSEPAANALLKTLEEPRSGSFIVLVTAASSALLPTVRSRCQAVRFRALAPGTVEALLIDEGMDPGAASLVASLSQGSMDRAAYYADEELEEKLGAVLSLISAAVETTPAEAMGAAAELRGDREGTIGALQLTLSVLEELLWLSTEGAGAESRPLASRIAGASPKLVSASRPRSVAGWIAACNRALVAMKRNNMNPQLALEGFVTSLRGRRDAGESWSRIGAR